MGMTFTQDGPVAAPAPAPAPRSTGSGLAIAALVVGIVAFLTGLVPILGTLVGLVAVVLGIIALVKKQSKALALTGLILGGIGLIVSLLSGLILGAFAGAAVDAIDEQTNVTTETVPATGTDTAEEEVATADGTRESPLPLATKVTSTDWEVTISAFTADASAAVASANEFNSPAAEGTQYAMVDLSALYTGEGEGSSMLVAVDYVTADGTVISAWDNLVVSVEPQFGLASLYAGAADTGKLVFEIPSSADGLLRVTAGAFADDVFLTLQ